MIRVIFLVVLLIVGCSDQASEGLQVTIEASKGQVEVFEPVAFTAELLFKGTPLKNGAEIEFELINPQGQSIGLVIPTNVGDGSYTIETSFDLAGTYKVIAHVSYEGLHEMPEVEVTLQ
jgi:hypothetical protein